jgi:hypothetical protein
MVAKRRLRGEPVLTVSYDWEPFHTPHALRIEFSDADPNRRQRDPLLDNPSDPHPYLNAVMDLALMRLTLTANGATQAWGPDAGMRKGSKGESRAPTDFDTWTVDQLAWDYYYGASTHRGRLRVLKQAQELAHSATTSDPGLRKGTREWQERIAADERPYKVLQRVYGIGPNTVAKLKKEMRERTLSALC